jgi:DNA-binding NarL/FixJ family response regulator
VATSEPRVAPRLWRVRGDALGELGRRAESLEVLYSARRTAIEFGARAETWRIDASLARALRAMGRREEAERAIGAARAILEHLTAEVDDPALRETFVRGAEQIVPPAAVLSASRAAKAQFGGLTTRERDVARLIASGLSNRAIADRLIVGERTVESYVGNVLSKLAFTSRAQIAAWAVESGLVETAG